MALLTAPVNTLADFQIEYDGLLLGPGTPYDLPPGLSLLDIVAVRNTDTDRDNGRDGAFSGPDSVPVITFDVPFELYSASNSDSAWDAALAALRMAIRVRESDAPLWFKLPGLPAYGIGARVNRRALTIDNTWRRLAIGAAQFRCVRPQLQTIARTAQVTGGNPTSGLIYPLYASRATNGAGAVMDYGGTTAASFSTVLTNAGNTPAYPVVVVQGPSADGFTLSLDGHAVTYPAALAAGDTVSVDYATGQAYLSAGGTTPVQRTGLLTSRDFTAVPLNGSSTFVLIAAGGSALVSTADIWRG